MQRRNEVYTGENAVNHLSVHELDRDVRTSSVVVVVAGIAAGVSRRTLRGAQLAQFRRNRTAASRHELRPVYQLAASGVKYISSR